MQSFTTQELHGRTVYSADGDKLGSVEGVLEDDHGEPQYLELRSGWFGTKRHAIPLSGLQRTRDGNDVVVPYTAGRLREAPLLSDSESLTYARERELGAFYGTDVRGWDDARDRWLSGDDEARDATLASRQAMRLAKGEGPHYTRGNYGDVGESDTVFEGPQFTRGHYGELGERVAGGGVPQYTRRDYGEPGQRVDDRTGPQYTRGDYGEPGERIRVRRRAAA